MTILEQMQARLAELRKQYDDMYAQRGEIVDKATAEKRGLTTEELGIYETLSAKRAELERDMKPVADRVAELEEAEAREAAAAEGRKGLGTDPVKGGARVTDPEVYAKGNPARSFFRDLARAQLSSDSDAIDRLRRHSLAQADMERRALGDTNAAGGSGGEFAPPEWLVQDWIRLARPGRVIADLYKHSDVPRGVSSVNLPKILTGTSVALQSTQNTALSQTDLTTGSVTTGFSTIGGKQVVSQQMLDQSEINFDDVVTTDLAAAYAVTLGTNIISGAGTGSGTNSVVNGLTNATVPADNQITFTSGSPTAALFYSKAAGMLAAFATNRFAQPTVWVMHPRRWFWLLAQVDSNGRPLVVPNSYAFNPIAAITDGDQSTVAGSVGTFLGLPVVTDPLLPTNLGGGSSQDEVWLLKADDLWLFESPPVAEVFREPYADSMGILFRLYAYVGTILNRQGASIATMNGTGLVTPTF